MAGDSWPQAETAISVRPACCDEELYTSVLGADGDELVIVAPEHKCIPAIPTPDTAALVGWGTPTAHLARPARVAGTSDRNHWRLTADGPVNSIQRRNFVRVPVDVGVELNTRTGPVEATVLDLSEAGIRCSTPSDARLAEDEPVDLVLPLPDGDLELRGTIMWVRDLRQDLDLVGIKLLGVTDQSADRLRKHIFAEQLAQRRKGL